MKALLIALALMLTAPISGQDPPEKPAQNSSGKIDTCTVQGVVVADATGEPLKAAHVGLSEVEKVRGLRLQSYRGVTDASGHFAITGVPAGRYRFAASKNGYVPQSYRADAKSGPEVVLELAAGQRLDKVQFRLVRAAVIMGRIADENGEPVAGVEMEALVVGVKMDDVEIPVAKGQWVPVKTAVTNDLGEYRIHGLPPGTYYLAAIDSGIPELSEVQESGVAISLDDLPPTGHPPLYYPGVTRRNEAQKIRLSAGQETHIDLSLRTEKMLTIAGRVIDPNGKPAAGAWVRLTSRNLDTMFSSFRYTAETDAQGKFEVKGVPPGSYALSATLMRDEKRYSADQQVEVAGDNVAGLHLQLSGGLKLTGRLIATAARDVDLNDVRVWLSAVEGVESGFGVAEVKKDGTFIVSELRRTTYRLNVTGLPDGWYLSSATLGAENVLDEGLKLAEGAAGRLLELTAKPGAGQIEGVVFKADDPVPGASVKLLPEHASLYRKDLARTATTDQHGRFVMKNVVPGSYRALAVIGEGDDEEDDSSLDASAGTSIVLGEKESKTVQLKLRSTREQ